MYQYSSPLIIWPLILRTLGYPNSFRSNTTIKIFMSTFEHCSFLWFIEILQIAKMATKYKCIVLSIEDKITIYECLDRVSSMREITHEYIWYQQVDCFSTLLETVFIYLFDYPDFWLSEQALVSRVSDNRGSTVATKQWNKQASTKMSSNMVIFRYAWYWSYDEFICV